MRTAMISIHANILRNGLPVALVIGALTVLSARVPAAELDPITISAPDARTVGHNLATGESIQKITVKAHIAADSETLRNESGVVLLQDRVFEAARKACHAADPLDQDNHATCIHEAVKSAQPEVAAAIARARSTSATG